MISVGIFGGLVVFGTVGLSISPVVLSGEDSLNRGGESTLTTGDLLPIQQLARLDDDMLHSAASSKPVRLAAEVWRDRHQE